jgi:hypothetical protein
MHVCPNAGASWKRHAREDKKLLRSGINAEIDPWIADAVYPVHVILFFGGIHDFTHAAERHDYSVDGGKAGSGQRPGGKYIRSIVVRHFDFSDNRRSRCAD